MRLWPKRFFNSLFDLALLAWKLLRLSEAEEEKVETLNFTLLKTSKCVLFFFSVTFSFQK